MNFAITSLLVGTAAATSSILANSKVGVPIVSTEATVT